MSEKELACWWKKATGRRLSGRAKSVTATAELLSAYERIKLDLRRLLHGSAGEAP